MVTDRTNVICYEGIQRIFRNRIVGRIREVILETFPTDFESRLRKPFHNEEWEGIQRNSSAPRTSGALSAKLTDIFDLLSVNHFHNIFDLYYEFFFPEESKEHGVENKEKNRRKSKFLAWLRDIKELRDPLMHPGEEDFPREDGYFMLDCARRVLNRLNLAEEATEINRLMNSLFDFGEKGAATAREPLEDQLPAREAIVVDFIGRENELKELWAWFDDPVSRRWALAGEGGLGKSALAYDFAFQVKIKAPQPYQTVLWLSAKRKQFLEGQTVEIRSPDFSNLDSAVSKLLSHYGWTDEVDEPIATKKSTVLELLDKFPALLVIDDIDSVDREDEEVTDFLSFEVPHTKSKILFTSRRTIFGMGGSTTHVGGLNPSDSKKFIKSRSKLLNLDYSIFTDSVIQEIVQITEGSPLFIEDLMRLISVIPVKDAMSTWRDQGGNEARKYALGRECDLIETDGARRILMAASICRSAVSFVELESITGFDTKKISESLNELQRIFLVPKPRIIEGEERYEVNINTKILVREVFGKTDAYRRIEAACRFVNEGWTAKGNDEINTLIRQSAFLSKAGKYEEAERLLQNALEKFHSNPELISALANLYSTMTPPRLTDARANFNRAYQLKFANLAMFQKWTQLELERKEWSKASEAAEKGLGLLPQSKLLLYLAAKARSESGKENSGRFFYSKAAKEFEEAKELLRDALESKVSYADREKGVEPFIYKEMVDLCLALDDRSGADHYLWRWRCSHPDDGHADKLWKKLNA